MAENPVCKGEFLAEGVGVADDAGFLALIAHPPAVTTGDGGARLRSHGDEPGVYKILGIAGGA